MKMLFSLIAGVLFYSTAYAEFRTWTRMDGKTAELELLSVTGEGVEKTGDFKMRNGQSISLKASTFAEADAQLIAEWKAPPPMPKAKPSVFDEILDGNLVKLSGNKLKPFRDLKKPDKFYVFYYTASWCPPCQKFTPLLVDFYKKNKNDNFELVLITSDKSEEDMEGYAKAKEMPWPHLELKNVNDFEKKFPHGVSGIPSVIVCDLEGNTITSKGRDLAALGQLLK